MRMIDGQIEELDYRSAGDGAGVVTPDLIWFCDAYASWQKGGVENANGRLRRWLPRHIDIDKVSDEEIQDIVLTANLTPRKCLGFKTPFQAILKELGKDVQIRFS
jgi:transposase, IS30 family